MFNDLNNNTKVTNKKRETSLNKKSQKEKVINLKHLAKKPVYESNNRVFTKDVYMYYNNTSKGKGTRTHTSKSKGTSTSVSRDTQNGGQADKYNLIKRINNYRLLSKKLALLREDDCLEKKTFNGFEGYTIRNIINLEKKIGTKSKYATIYLTGVPGFHNPFPIATKVMKYNYSNVNEVNIMLIITRMLILTRVSRHFLMIYGHCTCSNIIDERLKLISINELADGDLKMLVSMRKVLQDNELMLNILFQTFISIATFHNIVGYVHRDAHYGNFLYQQNSEKGYYHYIFNDKNYYLKACTYNIIIYDYGFAKKINNHTVDKEVIRTQNHYIYGDYYKIIHAFINKKDRGWINSRNLPDSKITKIIMDISTIMYKNIYAELYYNNDKKNSLPYSFALFADIIDNVFLKYTPPGMFITQRPPNVINKIPFMIS
jgi:hypothetical protein